LKVFWRFLGRKILEILSGRTHRLSPKAQARLARIFAKLLWLFQKKRRRQILALMKEIIGREFSKIQLLQFRRDSYYNMGRNLAEFLLLPSLDDAGIDKLISLEGEEHLENALAQGRGIIIITAHFGNWELLGAKIAHLFEPGRFHVIAQTQSDERLTRLMDSVRNKHNVNVIPRGKAARDVLRVLKRGDIVGILMDVDMKDQGILVDFMGKPASTTTGPAAFALRTGAVILPVFDYPLPGGKHVGRIMPPVELVNTGDNEHDLHENTTTFNKIIALQVRYRPDLWIWAPDRWRSTREKAVNET